ncbi:DNA mismatch repair protein MutS, partial [hydrothermal vent metagenome]
FAEEIPETGHPALDSLKKTNPDELTPRQALDALYRLRELCDD